MCVVCVCVCVYLFSVISKQARVAWFIFELVSLLGKPGDISLSLSLQNTLKCHLRLCQGKESLFLCVCVWCVISDRRVQIGHKLIQRTEEQSLTFGCVV